jgi:hypothetical protein
MNSMNPLFTVQTWYYEQYRPVMNIKYPLQKIQTWYYETVETRCEQYTPFMNSACHKKTVQKHGSLLVYRMTKLVVHYSLQFKIQILDFFIYVEYKLYILEAPFSPGFHVSILTFLFNKGERKYKTCIKNITENNMVLLLFYSIRSQN